MDLMTSSNTIRKQKIDSLFREIETRVTGNDSGELYITWKGTSVAIKFSHWLSSQESLTNNPKE